MKSLKTIQVLSKIGKIFSQVVCICSIVGFVGCIVGMISLVMGVDVIKIGEVTFHSILNAHEGVSSNTVYTALAIGMVYSAGEAILSKFAVHYFERELSDGTPFNKDGAQELFRLGILTICIPLGTIVLGEIIHGTMSSILSGIADMKMDGLASVGMGVTFIMTSVIFRCGAELMHGTAEIEKQA